MAEYERKPALPSAQDGRVPLIAPPSLVQAVARMGGNQAAGKLLKTLRGSKAMVQRFQTSKKLTTKEARDAVKAKAKEAHLTAAVNDVETELAALDAFETGQLPGIRADQKDPAAVEQKLLPAVGILDTLRKKVDAARSLLVANADYQKELAQEALADNPNAGEWHAFGKKLDAIADAVDLDLEAVRSGAYVDAAFAQKVASAQIKLAQLPQAVHKVQEGRLGLLDRIASYVLAIMHTHDHVEYSLDLQDLHKEASASKDAGVQGAWTTYQAAATELVYYQGVNLLVNAKSAGKVKAAVQTLRAGLQEVEDDFDPSKVASVDDAAKKKVTEVLTQYQAKVTHRDKWALAYEYIGSIIATKMNTQFINATPLSAKLKSGLQTASGQTLRALQGARLTQKTPADDTVAQTAKQVTNLSVTGRDKGELGHSDIQARNVAVALHGNTLLIGYNYTVKRFAGSEQIVLESNPPAGLVTDVLNALMSEIDAERAKADCSPQLLALQTVSFVTVPGGATWSGFHAEMQLLSYLQQTVGAALNPGSVAFGVGKSVCRRCTAQLDALQHTHRDSHFKKVSNWTAPAANLGGAVTATMNPKPVAAKKP
jgi:hypothetical protein